jgi:hypothetical protein
MLAPVNRTIQRNFYRSGQIHEEMPICNGRKHGLARTWHKNGILAYVEPYRDGVLHGTCRQWDETGKPLGKFVMNHGSGTLRSWHDNGQLQLEVTLLDGEFCGRSRIWLQDGTLVAERIYLHGNLVSTDEYRLAAAKNHRLPRLPRHAAKVPTKNLSLQKHIHRVFVHSLLGKPNHCDARKWLHKKPSDHTARSVGRFKRETDSLKFVEKLNLAGATEVIVPDIYQNKAGDQLADSLLVHLPKSPARRRAIRSVCSQLRKRKLGAVEPTEDIGESYLYLSMS